MSDPTFEQKKAMHDQLGQIRDLLGACVFPGSLAGQVAGAIQWLNMMALAQITPAQEEPKPDLKVVADEPNE